jgi:hypothetical protein
VVQYLFQPTFPGLLDWINVRFGVDMELLDLEPLVAESLFENVVASRFYFERYAGSKFGFTVSD